MPAPAEPHRMACMEVWGGCEPFDASVTLSGLDAYLFSRPHGGPASAAGGDVYYASACAAGRINRLLVADVSGHGPALQSVATSLRDLMRRYVNFYDQARFVAAMNRRFVASSDDGVFATAIVTTFLAPTRALSVCNAGHPPPLLYRAAAKRWSFLGHSDHPGESAGNIPLGILELEDYSCFDTELDVGDLVLIYTDALIEAATPAGQQLGLAGLLSLAAALDPTNPATLIPSLLAAIDAQTDHGLRADDVTCLLLRPNGTGRTMRLRDRLLAPVRLLAACAVACTGRAPFPRIEFSIPNLGGLFIPSLQKRRR